MAKHYLYASWKRMRARCNNSNYENYHRYGGRGITVCKRWDDFNLFIRDMGDRPEDHTLERLDNNGNYEPNNCSWATKAAQSINKSNNICITLFGRTQVLSEWAKELGINYKTVQSRLNYGWDIERALTTKVLKSKY